MSDDNPQAPALYARPDAAAEAYYLGALSGMVAAATAVRRMAEETRRDGAVGVASVRDYVTGLDVAANRLIQAASALESCAPEFVQAYGAAAAAGGEGGGD